MTHDDPRQRPGYAENPLGSDYDPPSTMSAEDRHALFMIRAHDALHANRARADRETPPTPTGLAAVAMNLLVIAFVFGALMVMIGL